MAVSNRPGNQMDDKIGWAAVARVSICEMFLSWSIMDSMMARLREPQFIRKMHEPIGHVFAQTGDELESLFKELGSQRSRDIAAISDQFASQTFDQCWNRLAVIDIAWRQTTRKPLATIIDGQVQLETKEPAHSRLASPGISSKDPMLTDPFGVTDFQGGRIVKTDPGASAKSARAA